MRKIASQIPDVVSRLLRSTHISTPPTWYGPVLTNPPPVLRPHRERPRPSTDLRKRKELTTAGVGIKKGESDLRTKKWGAKPIIYEEDSIRRQFFRDFPFEALRPTSLVELRAVEVLHPVRGEEWTSLEQRGAYPTVEDTIEFALLLRDRGTSLSHAYSQATKEFVRLRAKHEMATLAAETEARAYGAEFLADQFTKYHKHERAALDSHLAASKKAENTTVDRVRYQPLKTNSQWTSNVDAHALPSDDYTGGKAYIEKWKIQPERKPEITSLSQARIQDGRTKPEEEQKSEETSEKKGDAAEEMDELEYLEKVLGTKKE